MKLTAYFSQGETGVPGPPGFNGNDGPQGLDGDPGAPGRDGRRGQRVSGRGARKGEGGGGDNGTHYLDLVNLTKDDVHWILHCQPNCHLLVISVLVHCPPLQGPQGSIGSDGLAGLPVSAHCDIMLQCNVTQCVTYSGGSRILKTGVRIIRCMKSAKIFA